MTEFSNRNLLEIQESDPPAEICLRGLVLRLDVLYRLPVSLRPLSSLMERTRPLRSLWEPKLVLMELTRPSESLPRDMGSNQFVLRHLLSAPSKTDGRRAQCKQIEEQS